VTVSTNGHRTNGAAKRAAYRVSLEDGTPLTGRWLALAVVVSIGANVLSHYPEVAATVGPLLSSWPPLALFETHCLTHTGRSTPMTELVQPSYARAGSRSGCLLPRSALECHTPRVCSCRFNDDK
jgi:hypothetical protein